MVGLKLKLNHLFQILVIDLHSTMVGLKPFSPFIKLLKASLFTFHYGRIKTKVMKSIMESIATFTFHYGRIKTSFIF